MTWVAVGEREGIDPSRIGACERFTDNIERIRTIIQLLWHAAGTLRRHDADRIKQALAGDSDLARRYDLVREELAQTIYLNERLGAPSACAANCSPRSMPRIPSRGVRSDSSCV
jgi:hypothetical protein